jgi:hypothetical protein
MGAAIVSPIVVEHDDGSSDRHPPPSYDLRRIFSEDRYPLFRITLWKHSILQWFARQRKQHAARQSKPLRRSIIDRPFAPAQKAPVGTGLQFTDE